MTDIWKLPNGNYLRHSASCEEPFVEFSPPGAFVLYAHSDLPADAVPMVPETGRQVTGEELFDAWGHGGSWSLGHQAEHVQQTWDAAAERLNLRVREPEPRQPWDVLREAADIVEKRWPLTTCARVGWLRDSADELEAAAKEKSQRDREIVAVQQALDDVGITTAAAERVVEYLDAVRGEQA